MYLLFCQDMFLSVQLWLDTARKLRKNNNSKLDVTVDELEVNEEDFCFVSIRKSSSVI